MEVSLQTAKKIQSNNILLGRDIKAHKEKADKLSEDRNRYMEKLQDLQKTGKDIENLRLKRDLEKRNLMERIKEKEEARNQVKEDLEGTTKQLKDAKVEVQGQISKLENRIQNLNEKYSALIDEKSNMERELNSVTMAIGQAQAEQVQYDKDKKQCEITTIQCCRRYKLAGIDVDGSMTIQTFEHVAESLKRLTEENTIREKKHKKQATDADAEFEREIAMISENMRRVSQDESYRREEKKKLSVQLRNIEDEKRLIAAQLGSESDVNVNVQVVKLEAELKKLKDMEDSSSCQNQINAKMRRLETGNSDLELLKMQQQEFQGASEARMQLKLRQQGFKHRKSELEQKFNEKKIEFCDLYKVEQVTPETIIAENKRGLQCLSAEIVKDDAQHAELDRQVSSFEGELHSTKSQVDTIRKEIFREKELFEAKSICIEEKGLPELISEFEKQHKNVKEEVDMWEPFLKIYNILKMQAHKSHKCSLCERSLDEGQLREFDSLVDKKIRSLSKSDQKRKFMEKEAKLASKLSTHRNMLGNWTNYQQLSRQLPQAKKKMVELENKVISAKKAREAKSIMRNTRRRRMQKMEALQPVITKIGLLMEKCRDDERKIQQEKEALPAGFSEEDVAKVEADIDRISRENTNLRREINDLIARQRTTLKRREELQSKVNELREKQAAHQRLHLKLEALDKETFQKEKRILELDAKMKTLKEELQPIRDKLERVNRARKDCREKHGKQEKMLQKWRQDLLGEFNILRGKIVSLKELGSVEKRSERENLFRQKVRFQKAIAETDEKRKNLIRTKEKCTKLIKTKEDSQHKIDTMLNYKEKCEKVVVARKRAEELHVQLKEHGGLDLEGSTEKVRERISLLQSRVDKLQGKIAAKKQQITRNDEELATPRLFDVEEKHRKLMIETYINKKALKDLEVYSNALELALMEYHSAKMEEINDVLRDYWSTTYCGRDIEEIRIESNHTTELKGRRQYNYRVVMKQRDTLLDMRGRCSAGQKVLASLLIRLALAETFCTKCGVLALDEPTTNLDQANIRQFARALNEIIQRRLEQKNFQLIIITHDEEFVDMLGQRDHCDYYYRVYKDEEQNSRIKQQPFE